MKEDFDRSPYTKKAFELAYAMLRIGESVSPGSVRARLDVFAHQLLEVFAESQYKKAPELIEETGWFVRLWTDVEIVPRHLGEALLTELSKLKDLSHQAAEKMATTKEFSAFLPISPSSLADSFSVQTTAPKKHQEPPRKISPRLPDSVPVGDNSHHYDSSSRQSAIVDFFKGRPSSGNILPVCRMKDVQEKFPAVSERTLRYDLQKLVEAGLIDRVGAGPMSAYRLAGSPDKGVTSSLSDRYNNQLLQKEPLGEGTGKVFENSL